MNRLLTFTQKCTNSDNNLVSFVARYAVWYGTSPLGCSIFHCYSRYDFEYENFMSLSHQYIHGYYWSVISREDVDKARALLELLFIRSGVYQLNNFSNFSVSDVSALIYSLCTCWFFVFLHFYAHFALSLFFVLCVHFRNKYVYTAFT